jgi:hypothetical protein
MVVRIMWMSVAHPRTVWVLIRKESRQVTPQDKKSRQNVQMRGRTTSLVLAVVAVKLQ